MCQFVGVGVNEFIELVPDNPSLQRYALTIHDARFDEFTSSLSVWCEALHHPQKQGRNTGINTETPELISGPFDRAVAAGHCETNVMSPINVLHRES